MKVISILFFLSFINAQIALPTFHAVHKPHTSTVSYSDTITFTNCGATARNGPTQNQVNSTYPSGNSLYNNVTINTQGIQEWTVPSTGSYIIEAWGAQGGDSKKAPLYDQGGHGARMKGSFSLTQGEVIKIVVGQSGLQGNNAGGSGGGGTFVIKSSYNSNSSILIIAGAGGGGGPMNSNSTYINGRTETSGGQSYDEDGNVISGGSNGNGGGADNETDGSAGGGGFFTDGDESYSSNYEGKAFVNGATGGAGHSNGYGGFGGGGGMHGYWTGGGGGGGYSGGAGGSNYSNTSYAGGGGGSYNSGINQDNSSGVKEGHGQVIIIY